MEGGGRGCRCRRPSIAALTLVLTLALTFELQVTLRQRSFGSQRFDAFSLLCLPDHAAEPAANAASPARPAAAPAAPSAPAAPAAPPPRSDDPWHGVPTSVTLHLVPSSPASVTLRATRAADRASSTS